MFAALSALHRQSRFGRWFRLHFAVALAVFVVGLLFGYAAALAVEPSLLSELARRGDVFPDRLTTWYILSNNARVLSMMLLGVFTLGLLTLFALFVNGVVIGLVGTLALANLSPLVLAALLVPHGVLEIPVFLLAGALALRVTHRVVRYLLAYDETPLTRVEGYELAVLIVVMFGLLTAAAWIEVNVTPAVARAVQ
jgi:stage II sporulation protein M